MTAGTPRLRDSRPADLPVRSDPDALLGALREHIALARRASARDPATGRGPDGLAAALAQATAVADIGTTLPPLAHLSLPRRVLARVTGRLVLYFLRLVTVDQQQFNRSAVSAMRAQSADTDTLRDRIAALVPAVDLAREEWRLVLARVTALEALVMAERDARREQIAAVSALSEAVRAQAGALADLREANGHLLLQGDALRRCLATPPREAPGARGVGHPALAVDQMLAAETFRGSETAIRERQRRYVAYFEGLDNVLDVGCGRGEFLQLLREAGVSARGVDLDEDLALWCTEQGLDVRCMDALAYLAEVPDAELGGIFCAQVVEHLRTEALLEFLGLAARKLRPGGRLVIETLNPESLLVLYRWFWMDLTHERLVHPETLMFVLRSNGFRDVTCDFLPPPPGPLHIPVLQLPGDPPPQLQEFNSATQYLNRLLYASFDYAVVAVR